MTTALDIIKASLRNISVLGTGVSLDDEEANDAFLMLNGFLAALSAQGGMVFYKTNETFNLTAASSYTIGTGGDFNTSRPNIITNITVNNGSSDRKLYAMDEMEYASISVKSTGGTPDSYFYDGNYPLGKIYFYPTPVGTETVTIYSQKPLDQFTGLSDTFEMPEENRLMLEFGLSELIAPQYEREASPTVRKMAKHFRNIVFAQNNRNVKNLSPMDTPDRKNDCFDIYRGYE